MNQALNCISGLPDDIEMYEHDEEHKKETDIDSFMDDFFVAKMRVVSLEQENAELKSKVASLQRWKEEIEKVMMNETINTDLRRSEPKQRHKSTEQECFYNFCQINKKDNVILSRMLTKVSTLGYSGMKKVPWSILKLELKSLFDSLSDEEKIKYLHKTRN
jgi:hypothetical protein